METLRREGTLMLGIEANVFQAAATAHVLLWEEPGLLKLSMSGIVHVRDRGVERFSDAGKVDA